MACLTNYAIQCHDVASGQTGDFLFDTAHWQKTGEFKAISPVFGGLAEFFAWDNANGNNRTSCYLVRNPLTLHTEAGMIQGAVIQYRNHFRRMATGGRWNVYREFDNFSGVIVTRDDDAPTGEILVSNVQAMTEQTMRIKLSASIRKGQ